jgi:hypothetical protein
VEVVPEGLVLGVVAALLGSVVGLVVGTVGLEQPHKTEKHRITDIKANILLYIFNPPNNKDNNHPKFKNWLLSPIVYT